MRTLARSGRVEATTDAAPEQVWAVVSDITRVGEWGHECHAGAWLDATTTAVPGARFGGSNRVGRWNWSRVNEVLRADAPRELSWRTVPTRRNRDSTVWRILIEPDGDRTRIVQTFEVVKLGPVMDRLIYLLVPAHRDRSAALADDLCRLGAVAAAEAVPVSG